MLDLGEIPKTLSSTTWYHATGEELADDNYLALDPKSPIVNSLVISKVSKDYAPAGINLISSTTLAPISESEVRKELSKFWKCDTRNWDLAARYEIKQSYKCTASDKQNISSINFNCGFRLSSAVGADFNLGAFY